jgi:trehalose-6-phosphate synthase
MFPYTGFRGKHPLPEEVKTCFEITGIIHFHKSDFPCSAEIIRVFPVFRQIIADIHRRLIIGKNTIFETWNKYDEKNKTYYTIFPRDTGDNHITVTSYSFFS